MLDKFLMAWPEPLKILGLSGCLLGTTMKAGRWMLSVREAHPVSGHEFILHQFQPTDLQFIINQFFSNVRRLVIKATDKKCVSWHQLPDCVTRKASFDPSAGTFTVEVYWKDLFRLGSTFVNWFEFLLESARPRNELRVTEIFVDACASLITREERTWFGLIDIKRLQENFDALAEAFWTLGIEVRWAELHSWSEGEEQDEDHEMLSV